MDTVSRHKGLNGNDVQGLRDRLGCETSMLYVESLVQLKRHNGSAEYFLFAVKRKEVLKIQDGSHGFHGRGVAATSDRRAYAGVCAFFVLGVACTKQVS